MRRRRPGHGHHLRAPVLNEPYAEVELVRWTGPVAPDDRDANFKHDVAAYAHADPLRTISNLASALDLPVGAVVHYVLARWAAAGSEALLELGPDAARSLHAVAAAAMAEDTDTARLRALDELHQRLSWLMIPLDDPDTVFGP